MFHFLALAAQNLNKMIESDWYGIDVCKCEGRLNYSQRMCSDGVCHKCGHATKGDVCETNKVVLKEIKHHG